MSDNRDDSFARFFKQNFRVVSRYVSKLVSAPDVADELTQEAFARVSLVGLDSVQSPQGLLMRTAKNLAIDHVRRSRIVSFESLDGGTVAEIGDSAPSAEDWVAAREELERVGEVIKELPPKCRRVFLLLRVEELSFKEVAAEMGLSETMVRKYAARALEHCQLRLGRKRF